jgi:type III secretion protein S
MTETDLLPHVQATLILILALSAPVLAVAAGVGLLVGLVQAVTQIQDQSLPQILKLVAVLLTIVLLGSVLTGPLVQAAQQAFDDIPSVSR